MVIVVYGRDAIVCDFCAHVTPHDRDVISPRARDEVTLCTRA
jgi:hypothetical protein